MNMIERSLQLMENRQFKEALPLMKEIIARAPHISISWFNYGICLSELSWHAKAAEAFLHAYELDEQDYGALYRACVALTKANDEKQLLAIFKRLCQLDPSMINELVNDKLFAPLFEKPQFRKLQKRY